MKKINKIIIFISILFILSHTTVLAHGGNITGWKDKNSDKIMEQDGKYYGYHNQNGERHYHEVQWNEEKQKWEIVKTAVYYDENLNRIDMAEEQSTEKIEVKFSEKVDGDTAKFELNGEMITVRFLGIDTPETVHPTKGEEPFGKEASKFTEEALKNANKIELEYDSHASETDKYGRHLAWIWVDGALLQEELIQNGLAKTYMLQDNYNYAGVLQEAEETAKLEKKSLWSTEKTENNSKTNEEKSVEENDKTLEVLLLGMAFVVGILIRIGKKRC